jgi:BCD family chlorophyll transporter-like MFS transporter
VGLALATDLVPEEDQPKVVGLMYVMLLFGMIVSALVVGYLLEPFSPGRLIQVIQGTAVITILLNSIALWKQEPRDRMRQFRPVETSSFATAWGRFAARKGAMRLLTVIGLGAAGFGMADVLLEPYGGQVLALSVAQTTKLTAVFAFGMLLGFGLASRALGRGGRPVSVGAAGALVGMAAFAAIILSPVLGGPVLFAGATLAAGFGAGLFGHGTLTAAMRAAPREQVGLALGAWGAVQATAAGLAVAAAGITRDVVVGLGDVAIDDALAPFTTVFAIEIALLVLALLVAVPLLRAHLDPRQINAKSTTDDPVTASHAQPLSGA